MASVKQGFQKADDLARSVTWRQRSIADSFDPVTGAVTATTFDLVTRAFVVPVASIQKWVGGITMIVGDVGVIFERRQLEVAATAQAKTFSPAVDATIIIAARRAS